jgi:SAM-dependent methyltransferase
MRRRNSAAISPNSVTSTAAILSPSGAGVRATGRRLSYGRNVNDVDPTRASSGISAEQKAERAGSFGGVASLYERYRPGPPAAAVDWFVPSRVSRVVDLGAGTGALTRLLIDRADEVVAIEPDDRMRSVLEQQVPGVRALAGRGESMPLPDGCADAVLASSSWHWMDPIPALLEVGRVLVPGGIIGAVWSGPDPEGSLIVQARAFLAEQLSEGTRVSTSEFEVPAGVPFDQPDHETFKWEIALNADELIGMLGTFSWIVTMPDDRREHLFVEARRMLRELLGVSGDVTFDVAFRADAWRSRRV